MSLFENSWDWLALQLGFADNHQEWRDRLLACYAEKPRAYHTQQHLMECLGWSAVLREKIPRAEETELALWFHDAVYRPRASDNEVQSAESAAKALCELGVEALVSERICHGVLATQHSSAHSGAYPWLLDIDLSILGADASRFAQYEQQVRKEYAWVPMFLYRKKRAEVLRHFLARERLFSTDYFYEKLELRARQNIRVSLHSLSGGLRTEA